MALEGSLGKYIQKDDRRKAYETVTGNTLPHGEDVSDEEKLSEILSPSGDPEKRILAGILMADMLNPAEQQALYNTYKDKTAIDPRLRTKVSRISLELSQRLPVFEAAKQLFSSKELLHIASLDANGFGNIAQPYEEARLKGLVDMFIGRLAVKNIGALSNMVQLMRAANDSMQRPEFKKLQADTDWAIRVSGYTEDELDMIINPADRRGSERKIDEKIRERITGYHQVTNWLKNKTGFGRGSERAASEIFDIRTTIDRNRAVIDIRNKMKSVGRMLSLTMHSDTAFKTAADIEAISGEQFTHETLEPVLSFGNIREREQAMRAATEKAIQDRFVRDANTVTKALHGNRRNYYTLTTDAERDAVRTRILDDLESDGTLSGIQNAYGQPGSSIFSKIFASFVSLLFGNSGATPAVPGSYRGTMRTLMPDDLIQRQSRKKKRR
ncbi:hypothetical protein HY414_00890 [Candidatus Kaiserbacteria bacterium]|nr:hypothetical protein [Candidatus Kaiserbacteria bacterium]